MASARTEVQVRPGTEGDLAPHTELYNHDVRETSVTFDTEPFTPEQRRPWLHSHPEDGPRRLLVASDVRNDTNSRITPPYWDVVWYEKRLGPGD